MRISALQCPGLERSAGRAGNGLLRLDVEEGKDGRPWPTIVELFGWLQSDGFAVCV